MGALEKGDMSFVHRIVVGHIDLAAVAERRLVVNRAIDLAFARSLLGVGAEGVSEVGGLDAFVRDACVDLPLFAPGLNRQAWEIARKIALREGCLIADIR